MNEPESSTFFGVRAGTKSSRVPVGADRPFHLMEVQSWLPEPPNCWVVG
jgi:hypothetical protein